MKVRQQKKLRLSKIVSGGTHGAIDPHTHIYPRRSSRRSQGPLWSDSQIEPGKECDWITIRGKVLGRSGSSEQDKASCCRVDLRLKDMERMGVDRQILSCFPSDALHHGC